MLKQHVEEVREIRVLFVYIYNVCYMLCMYVYLYYILKCYVYYVFIFIVRSEI